MPLGNRQLSSHSDSSVNFVNAVNPSPQPSSNQAVQLGPVSSSITSADGLQQWQHLSFFQFTNSDEGGVVTLLQGSARSLLELKQRLQQEESRVQVRLVSGWSIQPRRPLAEGRILLLCHQPGKGRALWRCTCSRKRAERVEGGARGGYCDPHSHRMAAYARVPQKS